MIRFVRRQANFRPLILAADGGKCHWETEKLLEQLAHAFPTKTQESWKAWKTLLTSADDGNYQRILSLLPKMALEENSI